MAGMLFKNPHEGDSGYITISLSETVVKDLFACHRFLLILFLFSGELIWILRGEKDAPEAAVCAK